MKRLILLFCLATITFSFATDLDEIKKEYEQYVGLMTKVSPSPQNIKVEEVLNFLNNGEAPFALLYEYSDLFIWQLFSNCYFDWSIDEIGSYTYSDIDYKPSDDFFAIIPAFFYNKTKRPYSLLSDYKDYMIGVWEAVGTDVVVLRDQVSNKYGYSGYEYVMAFTFSGIRMVTHSYFLMKDDVCCVVYYTTADAYYDNALYQVFFDLIMDALDFGQSSSAPNLNASNPVSFDLNQNYPNPFNASTTIKYTISVPSLVRLEVFNTNGKLVETLLNEYHNPGNYAIDFDASDLSSGIYVYRISNETGTRAQRMLLIK